MNNVSRKEQYEQIIPQIKALIATETDMIANMANLSAVLKETFNFLWVGFYLVKSEELVLGPFQGRVACTRIQYGKGVCGTAWKENQTILVPDVHAFAGHIVCDSASRSEIVVPVRYQDAVIAVLDIDSALENDFSEIDSLNLEKIIDIFQTLLP
ncbi:MAG: hypothetical protein RL662_680 [Bacteroidota bacterium]|jgi:GAF domain-containing protein